MVVATSDAEPSKELSPPSGFPVTTPRFEQLYAIFGFWLLTGAYYDAWTHTYTPELESFFTPAHGLLYAGGLSLVALIVYTAVKNMAIGFPLKRALPLGYFTGLIGAGAFVLAGIGDMVWHILFGIENDLEAAFSATHLLLVVAFFLLVGSPLFSLMARGNAAPSIRKDWPAMFGFMLVLSALTVITQWSHPIVNLQATYVTEGNVDIGHSLGILGIILQTVFILALMLPIAYHRVLPAGSFTFALTLNATYLAFMSYAFVLIIPYVITGIFADFYYARHDFRTQDGPFRIFAGAITIILYSLYFLILAVFMELAWNAHIVSGGIFFPTIVALLLSYTVKKPEFSDD
ncbi:MAG: hypothetical protein ACXAE3_00065 [Candidatus Kariarchaeaceae archaeon]|jgi:hypothetical protein